MGGTGDRAGPATGTCPYVVANAVAGQSAAYTVRKGYTRGPGGATTATRGLPAKIVVRSVPSKATQANLLSTGALNFGQVNEDDMSRFSARGLKNLEYPGAGSWLTFNQRDDRPGADLRVRQALAMALNSHRERRLSMGRRTPRAVAECRPAGSPSGGGRERRCRPRVGPAARLPGCPSGGSAGRVVVGMGRTGLRRGSSFGPATATSRAPSRRACRRP
jgi:hypothetical protein